LSKFGEEEEGKDIGGLRYLLGCKGCSTMEEWKGGGRIGEEAKLAH
jgi:hypothetical protein